MICERCGQVHLRCTAHNRAGGPCGRFPMRGIKVCYKHGGATQAAREKGLRNIEIQEAERRDLRLLEQFRAEVDPNLSVIDNYDRALAVSVAWLEICQQQLEALTSVAFETKAGERKLDARIALFERSLDRVEKFLNNAQHLDLEERRVRVTEAQKTEVAKAWQRATQDLFARLRAALPPDALQALATVEQAAPEIARKALTEGPHS